VSIGEPLHERSNYMSDDEPRRRRSLATDDRVSRRQTQDRADRAPRYGGIAVSVQPLPRQLDELGRVQYLDRGDRALDALMKHAGAAGYGLDDDPLELCYGLE
jgi:hypothetical protein